MAGYNYTLTDSLDLHATLRQYWGYDQFRPLQESIIRSILSGADVAVIMPTGGGKSLCYQLPALALRRTTVVISPLIALMQDQAAQLEQMGVPAAVLNSSLSWQEQQFVLRNAQRGAYRLLYLSPERIAREDTLEWLRNIPLALFAIDEAHCISEWGHEFRPEYRQLRMLRENFPDVPIAAFTASATKPVRHDILLQLRLRDPHKYIVSFHRPNLRYLVKECDSKSQSKLLLRSIAAHAGSNLIVYAPTIASVEETVDFLIDNNIDALPYHGKLEGAERRRNQDKWMNDEVRVLVGTLAFGLGINKPAVRAVIHLALPKSIEQYYQEAGRAGRDGLPADCILLWRKKDAGLLAFFNEQIIDHDEKQRAWQRYHAIRAYGESQVCRPHLICRHFGENPNWESCGMCDVCAGLPGWLTAKTPKAARHPEKKFVPAAPPASDPVDAGLRDYMRQWRTQMALQDGVPAYIVLTDMSLDDLCRRKPCTQAELTQVLGIGEMKARRYGAGLLEAMAEFAQGARAESKPQAPAISTSEETVRLLAQGKSFAQIAEVRGRSVETVVNTVATLVESGRLPFREDWIRPQYRPLIDAQIEIHGTNYLKVLKAALPDEVTLHEIRLAVAAARRA